MTERPKDEPEFDVEGLDPDDTAEQLHPSAPRPETADPADDDFAEEPDYSENDG